MGNKQTSDLGPVRLPQIKGRVSEGVPSYAVDSSGGWRALSAQAGSLSDQLRGMAAKAAVREGSLAGMSAGQDAGQAYLTQRQSQHFADARVTQQPGVDVDHVNEAALTKFAGLQSRFGQQLTINSGYRDPDHNQAVGGARNSQHLHGNALDISTTGMSHEQVLDLIAKASAEGFGGIGVYDNSIHVDTGNRRAWGPSFGHDSVPAWAAGAIEAHLANQEAQIEQLPLGGGNALQTLPLQLRHDGTVYGDAFDAAAGRTFNWRMQEGLTRDLAQAFADHQDSPQAYEQAIGGIRSNYLADPSLSDPEIRESFDREFATAVGADRLQIASAHEQRLRQGEIAAAGDSLDANADQLERHAFNVGGNGDADAILAPEMERGLNRINAALAQDLISPAKAEQLRDQLGDRVARARIEGTFAALESPGAQEAYAQQILEDWSAGEGPVSGLTYAQASALSQTLFSRARAATNQQTAGQRVAAGQMRSLLDDDLASIGATGQPVTTQDGPIDPAEVEKLLGAQGLADWQNGRADAQQAYEATNGMEIQNAGEIRQRLDMLAPEPGTPGYEVQSAVFEAAQKRAAEILDERQADPLGQAARAGAIDLQPLDFSDAEHLDQSLQQRRTDAGAVADMYGQPARYFRPEEGAALADALMSNPDLLPLFAVSVSETFGNAAPEVLSELSQSGPAMAHAAGLVADTGDMSVVTDISRVLGARQDGADITLPSANKFGTAAASILGGALNTAPATQQAVEQVAQLLFERQAQLFGFDVGEINAAGSPANVAFTKSLNRALGATMRNGEQFGGLASVNGSQTILPSNLSAARANDLIGGLAAEDLTGQMRMGMPGSDMQIDPNRLRQAKLVAVGDGQYLMALGDPNGPDPQYVPGAGRNGFFVLDLRILDRQRMRRSNFQFNPFWMNSAQPGQTPPDPEGVGP